MRLSRSLIVTLREDPADAEVPSHRLLVRAGLINKLGAGLYIYSPLMLRVIRKVSEIVREEMDREGAQELLMPIMQPKEIWLESGRWHRYIADGIMFHMTDKKGSEVCLGPTHEEVITTYAKRTIQSHKQLPVNLYQIQDKFRDEIRPRFGLMRGREFTMKDAYSFDADQAGLDVSYASMDRAYRRIFERCGLQFRAVDADAGAIGGSGSQEFHVTAATGEDLIIVCTKCDYAANVEKADAAVPKSPDGGKPAAMEKHATPDVRSVEQLEAFFKLPAARMAKTLLYEAAFEDHTEVVAVMMRGDLEVNDVKLTNALGALAVKLANEEQVKAATGAEVGFAGPVGLKKGTKVFADLTLEGMTNLLTGCCTTGYHNLNVNPGRDFPEPDWRDLRRAKAGQQCVRCGGELGETRGIEVGHIFKLGTKYSTPMEAMFSDEGGKLQPLVMGCYGIGVSRTAAAAVEQNHDEGGIIWPRSIAPFEVVVAVIDAKREEQTKLGDKLYDELKEAGIDVCLDDRKMSAGAKFKDLDLIGFPLRIVVGRRSGEGVVEVSTRRAKEKSEIPAGDVLAWVKRS